MDGKQRVCKRMYGSLMGCMRMDDTQMVGTRKDGRLILPDDKWLDGRLNMSSDKWLDDR